MQIHFSENESKHLALKVGRVRIDTAIDAGVLCKEILQMDLDVVKMKVNALQQNIFHQLEQTGFPYFINSILYRNQIDYGKTVLNSLPEGYSYELYTEHSREIFRNMLAEIFDNTTGMNYSFPLYSLLVNEEKEKEMAISYYLNFESSSENGKAVWLLKEGNEFIGFVCGQFSSDAFEGIWYGVLPKYRTRGLSSLLIDIIQIECRKREVTQFFNDVQYQNIFSQLNVMRNGAVPIGTYLNVFVIPALSLVRNTGQMVANSDNLSSKEIVSKIFPDACAKGNTQTNFRQFSEMVPTHYKKVVIGKDNEFCIYNFYHDEKVTAQYRAVNSL